MMQPGASSATQQAVVEVARSSYGRLLSWLAYQWRDVAAAEDALSTALSKALELWPHQGIPHSPEAWLISVAKRELLQVARHQRLHNSPEVQALLEEPEFAQDVPAIPDARLKLLFICAHPAIDVKIRPALMLQTVLGLNADVVAKAMLVSPGAMAQRLVRAKLKMRDACLRFEEPDAHELPERLSAVLEAIYAAYGTGWDAVGGGEEPAVGVMEGLRSEALYLGVLICQLLPEAAEAWGLLALMNFCESRMAARYTRQGGFVPLSEQNTALWDKNAINRAEVCLQQAAGLKAPGPFQIEAAIQSAHCQRLFSHETPWLAVVDLYRQLLTLAPSAGATVAYAVACAQSGDLPMAQDLLDSLPLSQMVTYQPYWVAKAHVAQLSGNDALFNQDLTRAIGLTGSPAVRDYLLAKLTSP